MGIQVYNASAGSGKTFTLTKEFLKIILKAPQNDAYKKILAITFTNKAVEEMKSRIITSLIHFSQKIVPKKSADLLQKLADELSMTEPKIQEKSAKILKHIIHNYANFNVTTIDKFTLRLIKTFTHDLNLPVQFDVILDTKELLRQAVDLVISKAGEDEEITKILIEFAKNKAEDNKSWNVTNDILKTCEIILNEEHFLKFSALEDKTLTDFEMIKKQINYKTEALEKELIGLVNIIISDFETHQLTEKNFPYGTFYKHIFTLQKINDISAFAHDFTEKEIQTGKNDKQKSLVEELAANWKLLLTNIYSHHRNIYLLNQIKKHMVPLSLISNVYKEYKQIQTAQNGLSISEFNHLIHQQIKDQPAPFIYERIGSKFENYFIDEFQDTSILQWQNLIPLINNALSSENTENEPGTLMLVGDPKQAIYGFRGGKSEQFIQLSDKTNKNPFVHIEKEVKNLSTNYRSAQSIISFNNNFFQYVATTFTNQNYSKLYSETSYQEKNAEESGQVCIHFLLNEKNASDNHDDAYSDDYSDEESDWSVMDQKYLDKTLATILECQQNGFKLNEMVILTRVNKKGNMLANFLSQKNINIISSDSLLISNAGEVIFLINFLTYLFDENQTEAKINWLYYLAHDSLKTTNIHEFLTETKNLTKTELETFLNQHQFSVNFENLKNKSIYDIVEKIISIFIPHKACEANVMYFVDLVLEQDIKTQATISDFLNYWHQTGVKKSIPSPENSDAIRIMSIHKSKGLQFPVVIYPFADGKTTGQLEQMWVDINDDDIDLNLSLVNKSKNIALTSAQNEAKVQNRNQEIMLDEINSLYVALTRAETQLHVITNYKIAKPNSKSTTVLISDLFRNYLTGINAFTEEDFTYVYAEDIPQKPKIIKEQTEEVNLILPVFQQQITSVSEKLNFQAIKIAQKEALIWGTKQKEAIEFGNIIHQIMSYIHYKTEVQTALNFSIQEGLIATNDQLYFHETISQIINHPALIDFFNPENTVLNEQTILSENKNIKPDRIEINQQNAYLLDYKTGAHEKKHENQINAYATALEKMNFKVIKKCLVYIDQNIKVISL